MKIDHLATPGFLMKPVDVLSHQACDVSISLEPAQRTMRVVGLRTRDPFPAAEALCPVALSIHACTDELRVAHGLLVLPPTFIVPILRNTRCRAATRPGEDRDATVAGHECGELAYLVRGGVAFRAIRGQCLRR